MKIQYFDQNSIQGLAQDWIKTYSRPKQQKRQPFLINNAALLILDMQQYFLHPDSHAFVPSSPWIINNLNQIAAVFRSQDRPVVATRHINSRENAGQMEAWWSELLTEEHPQAALHPDLEIYPGEIIIKSQYDAFYDSDLASRLEANQVSQIVIGGVMTHLCCETTARSGFVRGYEVFFLVDGTATYNKDYHQATLRNLAHGVAVLTTANRLIDDARNQ
jgi:isochorismate hydrolase